MNNFIGKTAKNRYNCNWGIFSFLGVVFTAIFGFGLLEGAAEAQLMCSLEQVTDEAAGQSNAPSINSDGTLISFSSNNAFINGGNPEGNDEIFLFDTNTTSFTQITDETAGNSRFPSINSDGTRIAFQSSANIDGGNPEGNDEIFLFDTNTTSFMQITNEADGNSRTASINSDGTRIAFWSTANIEGGNPEGNEEVFLFDTNTMETTQITHETVEGSRFPSINSDGTRIAFQSTANIDGGNPEGNEEIFLFNTNTTSFMQITDEADGNSRTASINSDGTRIGFLSTANIDGGNPEGNQEAFLFDTNTMSTTQITDDTDGSSNDPAINSVGTRIAYASTANIDGGNPEGNDEIFLFDTNTTSFTQITDETAGFSASPSVNSDGTRIAFQTTANINGANPESNSEIFVAVCGGQAGNGVPGDANADGVINILDVTALLNHILEISPAAGDGDCNEDEQVNILDVTCVLNIILEL
jgi:dipeptidyl aminopeptidase/acylaminoacyl peptidase